MGFLSMAFGPSQPVSDPNGWLARAIGPRNDAGVTVTEHTALNLTSVYAAVGIRANTVAQLPMRLHQRTDRGSRIVDDHPLSAVLGVQPNPYMTPFTLRQVGEVHVSTWGNGYQEIERNRRGQTIGLWPLRPDATFPEREDGGIRYRTSIDGQQFRLPQDRVVHLKAMGNDGYAGLSPIRLHAQALGLTAAAEKFGAKFFANDAAAGGFLYHPGRLGDQAQENLRKSIEKQGGLENAHRVKILEEGMKWQQITIPPEDAQFLGTRQFQLEEIARIYGVPLILLQSHEKSTSWGTGIEQLIIGFVVWTIQPQIVHMEQELNRKLLTERERQGGLFIKCALQALLRGDMAARAAFYKTLVEISAMKPNEVRALEDMNTDPTLDTFYRPANWVRTDQPGATPAVVPPPPSGEPAP